MKQKIIHEQLLQQKMSRSLIQAVHLLQFSSMELIDYIKEISKDNPLIDEVNYDYDFSSYRGNSGYTPLEELNEGQLSMYDYLKEQLYTLKIKKDLKPIVDYGIDSLNETGYLDVELEEWATNCNTTLEKVKEALTLIQSLEPAGIAARTLSECILLQLKYRKVYEPFMEELLESHIDWIADENIVAMTEHFQLDKERVVNVLGEIKSCDPKPGLLLHQNKPEYIIPEASITKEYGEWMISFFKWSRPTLTINNEYTKLYELEQQETKNYLKEKYEQIKWLDQVLAYRSSTMEQVIRKIVEKQEMFFEHGYYMLKPLTLQNIADELSIHVSTVSRTLRNKSVQTTYGVIPLRFFLQSGVKQQDGQMIAVFTVKKLIREMVELEDKQEPFSDEIIRLKLHDEFGVSIARRTVMKYREQLRIPSSMKRKKRG